jgi:hypothetical protein
MYGSFLNKVSFGKLIADGGVIGIQLMCRNIGKRVKIQRLLKK